MSRLIYDQAYFLERDYLPSHLSACLDRLLPKHSVERVLEVGVGTGKLLRHLQGRGYKVEGIDDSPIAASLSGAILASATNMPFGAGTFDCVIAISLIEHLSEADGKRFIDETRRVLNGDGIVFLVTPNFGSPFRYLQGKRWFGYSDPTHITFYRPATMRSLLIREGFTDIQFVFEIDSAALEWPLPRIFKRLPPEARRIINRVLVSSPLARARDSLWVSARKK